MAKKKTAAETVETAESEPVVYAGPTIPKVAAKSTVYKNGIPPKLKSELERHPELAALLVPVSTLSRTMMEIEDRESGMGLLYRAAEKIIEGGN